MDQSSIISSLLDLRYKYSIFENGNRQESVKTLQEVFSLYSLLNTQPTSSTQMSSRDYFLNLLNNNNYCNDSDEELNRYFNSPCDSITDSLIWWKLHKNNYSVLSFLAKNYLSIQATSVPSERAFSISGLAITKTRNRLDPETARVTICMKYWISENIGEKK